MRQFIRHPSNIPITVEVDDVQYADKLKDIGFGGLCFTSMQALPRGHIVKIRIDVSNRPIEITARVVWNLRKDKVYDTGVEFVDEQDAYKARMVEQICQIEEYRNQVLREEGREMTSEQAALEWIERYAHKFPGAGEHRDS